MLSEGLWKGTDKRQVCRMGTEPISQDALTIEELEGHFLVCPLPFKQKKILRGISSFGKIQRGEHFTAFLGSLFRFRQQLAGH